MKENILDVLLFLFEHVLDADADLADGAGLRSHALLAELAEAGFSHAEIHKAFDWLDALARQRPAVARARADGPVRVYAGDELERLGVDGRGFLMFLEQHGVIDASQRELVLDRALALEQEAIELDDLKWVVLMALFGQPGSEAAYAWMQTQVSEDEPEPVH